MENQEIMEVEVADNCEETCEKEGKTVVTARDAACVAGGAAAGLGLFFGIKKLVKVVKTKIAKKKAKNSDETPDNNVED